MSEHYYKDDHWQKNHDHWPNDEDAMLIVARKARARALQSQLRSRRLEKINQKLSVLLESVNSNEQSGPLPEPPIRLEHESSRRSTPLTR